MKKPFESQELKVKNGLEGISQKMLDEHFKLYQGYVKKTNEIQDKIVSADKSEANGVYSQIGELKRQETFAINGMKLHEVYFNNLLPTTPEANEPKGEILKMIETDFGSYEAWKTDFIATGIASRGWAILAYDFKDDRLHNYGSDAHNVGAVWGASPLIAMDVYEHAYFMDYGVNRKDYLGSFFKNLNWDFVNNLVTTYGLDQRHAK